MPNTIDSHGQVVFLWTKVTKAQYHHPEAATMLRNILLNGLNVSAHIFELDKTPHHKCLPRESENVTIMSMFR